MGDLIKSLRKFFETHSKEEITEIWRSVDYLDTKDDYKVQDWLDGKLYNPATKKALERIDNYFDGISSEELYNKMKEYGFEFENTPTVLHVTVDEETDEIKIEEGVSE